jgi:sn1-specific diacylglycerol lipase
LTDDNPLKGAKQYRKILDGNDNIDPDEHIDMMHRKVTKLWLRRFRLAFCCVAKDEFGDEAFTQSAELFSHLFRGTDLVPSGKSNQSSTLLHVFNH